MLINNMQLFSDSTQSNLNFEPSFAATHRVEILANFEFWGYQICQQTVHNIDKFHLHFQLNLKRGYRNNEF